MMAFPIALTEPAFSTILSWLLNTPIIIAVVTTVIGLGGVIVAVIRVTSALRSAAGDSNPHAPIAVATLLDLQPTGTLINDVRQYRLHLHVHTPDGTEFDGEAKQLIPAHLLSQMQPGVMIPVTYDPAKPGKVGFPSGSRTAETQEALTQIRTRLGLADPRSSEIAASGVTTRGVVVGREPTGRIRHGHSELLLTVRFERRDGVMVERTKIAWLPPAWLSKFDVGAQVEITYLPHDDSQFVPGVEVFA